VGSVCSVPSDSSAQPAGCYHGHACRGGSDVSYHIIICVTLTSAQWWCSRRNQARRASSDDDDVHIAQVVERGPVRESTSSALQTGFDRLRAFGYSGSRTGNIKQAQDVGDFSFGSDITPAISHYTHRPKELGYIDLVVDSGASDHNVDPLIHGWDALSNIEPLTARVVVGCGHVSTAVARATLHGYFTLQRPAGSAGARTSKRVTMSFASVLVVPGFGCHLLSALKASRAGADVHLSSTGAYIKTGDIVMPLECESGVPVLRICDVNPVSQVQTSDRLQSNMKHALAVCVDYFFADISASSESASALTHTAYATGDVSTSSVAGDDIQDVNAHCGETNNGVLVSSDDVLDSTEQADEYLYDFTNLHDDISGESPAAASTVSVPPTAQSTLAKSSHHHACASATQSSAVRRRFRPRCRH
jgi:hypothetical protein